MELNFWAEQLEQNRNRIGSRQPQNSSSCGIIQRPLERQPQSSPLPPVSRLQCYPVNPFADEILGEKSYQSLLDIPQSIEIVDIFRPSEDVPSIVDEAIKLKQKHVTPRIVWMQLGIENEGAARRAREAGFTVVTKRCIIIEHRRLNR